MDTAAAAEHCPDWANEDGGIEKPPQFINPAFPWSRATLLAEAAIKPAARPRPAANHLGCGVCPSFGQGCAETRQSKQRMRNMPIWKAYLALAGLVLAWSSSVVAGKYLFSLYPLYLGVFLRMAFASLAFIFLRPHWRKVKVQAGDWKWLILMGLCDPCLYLTFEARALILTSASQAGVISATAPLLTAACAALFLKERLSLPVVIGFLTAFGGVAGMSLLSAGGDESAPSPLLGNFLEFIAIFWGALFVICAKRLSSSYPPIFLALVTTMCGLIYFLPPAVWSPFWEAPFINLKAIAAALYLGLAVTVAGMFCMNYALRNFSAGRVAASLNLVPVVTLLMGRLCLGEVMSWPQYALGLLVLAGTAISQRHMV